MWTESAERLWHSVSTVRRRRVLVYQPWRPLGHHCRAAIGLLRLLISAPLRSSGWKPLLWGGLGSGVIVAVYLGWDWQYREAWIWLSNGESDPARTIRDIVLALAAPITIMLAVWRSRIAAAGLLRDRYQRSAEMLGHPDLRSVRLGGIHTLADLADDHRSTFHLQTMQLFAAFVVERTSLDNTSGPVGPSTDAAVSRETDGSNDSEPSAGTEDLSQLMRATFSEGSDVPDLAADVREAIRHLAGRDRRQVTLERKKGSRLNLSGAVLIRLVQLDPAANFSNVDFSDADISHARLWDAQFSGTTMVGTRLRGASLMRANLRRVDMRGADLTCARLINADLRQANLGPRNRVGEWADRWENRRTRLRGARLTGADMRGIELRSADLRMAQLDGANLDNANLADADLRGADLKSCGVL